MYYRIWDTVLDCMKKQFMIQTGLGENAFFSKHEIGKCQAQYYLRNVNDNVNCPMESIHIQQFSSGKSVVGNLNYLASSYAMTFNYLGNEKTKINQNIYGLPPHDYSVTYRETLRALKSKNAFVSMDACLISEDGCACICMEMKMLEWFVFKINPIKDNFMEPENYFYPDTAKVFMDVIRLLIPYLQRDGWEHLGSFQNCDGFLLLRQILGLYNSIRRAKETGQKKEYHKFANVKQVTFATIYWFAKNPNCYGTYKERILHAEYRLGKEMGLLKDIMEPIKQLFHSTLGVELHIVNLDHRELLECLEKTPEEKIFMKRYDI